MIDYSYLSSVLPLIRNTTQGKQLQKFIHKDAMVRYVPVVAMSGLLIYSVIYKKSIGHISCFIPVGVLSAFAYAQYFNQKEKQIIKLLKEVNFQKNGVISMKRIYRPMYCSI